MQPNGKEDFLGFLMPRVTGLRPLMRVYNPQSRKKLCPLSTYAYLLRAARNLASGVSALRPAWDDITDTDLQRAREGEVSAKENARGTERRRHGPRARPS